MSQIVTVGLVGVYPTPYSGRPEGDRPPIEGLAVVQRPGGVAASWHARTGLYGFVSLAAGPHRFHLEDPLGRFSNRAFQATAPDRSEERDALRRGEPPTEVGEPAWVEVLVRPGPGRPASPHDTVVWGQVSRGDGGPAPFALVRIKRADGGWYATHADARGRYLALLPEESSAATGASRAWEAVPLASEVPPEAPLEAFPVDFDDFAEGPLDGVAPAYLPASAATGTLTLAVGARTRLDFHLS